MKKKRKSTWIILSLLFVILGIMGIIFFPKIVFYLDVKKLENEVQVINSYLDNKTKLSEVKKYLDKEVVSKKNSDLETIFEKYAQNILHENYLIEILQDQRIKNVLSEESLQELDYDDELKTFYNEVKDKLRLILSNLDTIVPVEAKDNNDVYQKLCKSINLEIYKQRVKNFLQDIDFIQECLLILNNKDIYKLEHRIVFSKRKTYKEYDEIQKKIINDYKYDIIKYQLIEDKEAPIIYADDLVLLKGDSYLGFKCLDDVDDEVECLINGDYDVNRVGTYNLEIIARDESGNKNSKNVELTIKEQKVYKVPYYIEILRNHNVVIVYGLDGNNQYTRIIKVFVCSVGLNNWTPTGTFTTSKGYEWGTLNGGLYGQYSTRIKGSILFHSVPYYSMDKNQIEWEEYNKLGEPASQGCIRMTVEDVKWIYDNCSSGVTVKIYDGDLPKNVLKPTAPKIDGNSPNRGWDPTDPDPNNPW